MKPKDLFQHIRPNLFIKRIGEHCFNQGEVGIIPTISLPFLPSQEELLALETTISSLKMLPLLKVIEEQDACFVVTEKIDLSSQSVFIIFFLKDSLYLCQGQVNSQTEDLLMFKIEKPFVRKEKRAQERLLLYPLRKVKIFFHDLIQAQTNNQRLPHEENKILDFTRFKNKEPIKEDVRESAPVSSLFFWAQEGTEKGLSIKIPFEWHEYFQSQSVHQNITIEIEHSDTNFEKIRPQGLGLVHFTLLETFQDKERPFAKVGLALLTPNHDWQKFINRALLEQNQFPDS